MGEGTSRPFPPPSQAVPCGMGRNSRPSRVPNSVPSPSWELSCQEAGLRARGSVSASEGQAGTALRDHHCLRGNWGPEGESGRLTTTQQVGGKAREVDGSPSTFHEEEAQGLEPAQSPSLWLLMPVSSLPWGVNPPHLWYVWFKRTNPPPLP